MDIKFFESIIQNAPKHSRAALKENLPYIVDALYDEGILTPNVLSYALATIQHETAGTFQPIEEYYGRSQARKYGYSGGEEYFGRGYIQLTHDYNYRDIGKKIGMGDQLHENPSLALQPEVAAKILAKFFKDRGIASLAESGDFIQARRPVNPDNKGQSIASIADGFKRVLSDESIKDYEKERNDAFMREYYPQYLPDTKPGFLDDPKNKAYLEELKEDSKRPMLERFIRFLLEPTMSTFLPKVEASEMPSSQKEQEKGWDIAKKQDPYTHTVQPGETLWSIAEKHLGSGNKWKNLGYQGDPKQLPIGTQIPMMSQEQMTRIPSPRVSVAQKNPTANQIALRLAQDNMQTTRNPSAQMQQKTEEPRITYTPRKPYIPPKPAPRPTPAQVSPIGTHMSGKLLYSDGSIK